MKTIGLSPKLVPAVIAIVVGVVVALVIDKTVGVSVLLTGVAGLGLGVAAPAGSVTPPEASSSDEKLPADASSLIGAAEVKS